MNNQLIYVEYAASCGFGTLVEHGVFEEGSPQSSNLMFGDIWPIIERITPERYREFVAIHGSEQAVP